MIESPSSVEWVEAAIDSRLEEMYTGIPGMIEVYDHSRQRASIQPLIKRSYVDENNDRVVENMPIINEVPVIFEGGGDHSITYPLSRGDIVWLEFSQSSLDKWLAGGGLVDPLNNQHHAIDDAVAHPGLRDKPLSATAVHPTAMVIATPSELKLGSSLAIDAVVKGTTYRAAEDTMLESIGLALGALAGDTALAAGTRTSCGDAAVAISDFLLLASTFLSSKVKTE